MDLNFRVISIGTRCLGYRHVRGVVDYV